MLQFLAVIAVFFLFRLAIRRRRRTNARRDMTQAFRADTAGLHPRSPSSLMDMVFRGGSGGL